MKPCTLLIVAVTLTAKSFAADAPAMHPLFNGRDLADWKGEGYVVEDDTIVCTSQGKNLITEQTFSSYILDFEFKLAPGGNCGLGIHYPGTGDGASTGLEIRIFDNSSSNYKSLTAAQFNGSLCNLAPAKESGLKPLGEWNRERVSVLGSAMIVEINGEIVLRANLDDLSARNPLHEGVKRRSGHIAWLGNNARVAFRNIQIAELPPAANVDGVKAAGFTRIFDGKTLAGWKPDPKNITEWRTGSGILKHHAVADESPDLWTQNEYGNFILVFDWRWSGRGPQKFQPIVLVDGTEKAGADGQPELIEIEELDSGIYLRGNIKSQVNLWNWTVGSGEIYGYRTDPSMPADVRAAVTPKAKADRPLGEWNRMMITMIGDRLTVSLNGRVVIENARLLGVPARGPIGLQHHGAAIDFANLWVKEL
ncbi:MAG: DUF1080 domain-containing protein [Luteolibacter sp.]